MCGLFHHDANEITRRRVSCSNKLGPLIRLLIELLVCPLRGGVYHREETIAGAVLKEIQARLRFLLDVGLNYLTLDRGAST